MSFENNKHAFLICPVLIIKRLDMVNFKRRFHGNGT